VPFLFELKVQLGRDVIDAPHTTHLSDRDGEIR
jgi:hypothetical protein